MSLLFSNLYPFTHDSYFLLCLNLAKRVKTKIKRKRSCYTPRFKDNLDKGDVLYEAALDAHTYSGLVSSSYFLLCLS